MTFLVCRTMCTDPGEVSARKPNVYFCGDEWLSCLHIKHVKLDERCRVVPPQLDPARSRQPNGGEDLGRREIRGLHSPPLLTLMVISTSCQTAIVTPSRSLVRAVPAENCPGCLPEDLQVKDE